MGILKPQKTALVTGSSRGIGAAGGRAVSVRADLTENEKLVHLFERTTDLGAPLGGGASSTTRAFSSWARMRR